VTKAENGYHLYDFKGTVLREEVIERFKQLAWRPRPPTMLSKDEQKKIRKNLREYSKVFDEQDIARRSKADREVIEHRRRLLQEWNSWRARVEEDLASEGLLPQVEEESEGTEAIEEMVEEVIDESEEIVT
jgi:translation initiation factor 3 subunit B